MKKLLTFTGLALALALSSPVTYAKGNGKAPSKSAKSYVCENGDKATVRYLDNNTLELSYKYDNKKPKVVKLKRARAGSGELFSAEKGFFGYGAEWHEKNGEVNLTYGTNEGDVSMSCEAAKDAARPTHTESAVFKCENGDTATIVYMGNQGIELRLKYDNTEPQIVRLKPAKSGSGSLYSARKGFFGWGAEWHEKGGEAHLSYNTPDGMVEVSCREK